MIDTSLFALPKPGHAAGRTVLSSSAYTRQKRDRWIEQDYLCARCFHPLASPADGHFHHLEKRGMGGGKRDDRHVALICENCHLIEEGQKPLEAA